MLRLAPALALLVLGCASGSKESKAPIGSSETVEQSEVDEEDAEETGPAQDVVPSAARPFTGLRTGDDLKLSPEHLMTHLAAADAVCVGERHDQVLDHFAELTTIQAFIERRSMRGFELGVGLEMVRTQYQGELSAFGAGMRTLPQFEKATAWETEWGFPIEYYSPQIDAAALYDVPLIALGVPRETTEQVASAGLASLPPETARQLPELDLTVAVHREIFDQMMEGHPGHADPENMYAAQVVWDESMADIGARWLAERAPGRKLIILAGIAHCQRTAIPARLHRRGGFKVTNLLPISDEETGDEDTEGAELDQRLRDEYDYHLVFDAN